MLIPEETVQEILERTDIVALVSRSVELKRAGRSHKGLCPFHGERTPSFTVSSERRRFKCFGCGAGGDAIAFVMRQEGKSFVEAVRSLAQQAGVRLEASAEDEKLSREKRELRRAHEVAARFFQERLFPPSGEPAGGPSAAPGREHLERRGVRPETARAFGLGYAPAAWNELTGRFVREGMLETALRSGLVSARENGPRKGSGPNAYDFFRGRLMIPIRSLDGATVGFGGRAIEGDDDRKFVNSRESPIFKKGELLFAISNARDAIRRSGQALLVEGYFDAIVLQQEGVANAVALCSASLTPEQVKLLRRCETREVVLVLDGDEAGRRGVTRAAGTLLSAGMPTRVLTLPSGVDPDEHVLALGAAKFKDEIARAMPLTDHLLSSALPEGPKASFEAKLRALSELRPVFQEIAEGLERSLFLTSLSRHLGVSEADLRAKLGEPPRRALQAAHPPPAPERTRARPASTVAPAVSVEELLLIAHLLVDPELARLPEAAVLEDLGHPGLRALAAEQVEAAIDGQARDADEILEGLDPLLARRIQDLMRVVLSEADSARREEFLQKCRVHGKRLARREEEQLQRQLGEIARRIAELKREGSAAAELAALEEEHLALAGQKRELAGARFRGASRGVGH
ncbi:MAG: DNA primase [Deltaproteobacteria bacterium]